MHFDFYNGACSTEQLKRMQAALKEIGEDDDVNTVVLMGGRTYFCNGINLNTIEVITGQITGQNSGTTFSAFRSGAKDSKTQQYNHLIQAAKNPSEESWLNINAIDDVILEFLKIKSKCIVANLARNAGAGGVMMALAADIVLSNKEIILNPAYSGMGLYGSEYWTYFFPERVLRNRLISFFESRDRLVKVGPRFSTGYL